ncbi:MAG: hypothetical protein CMC38_05570 [Flavobacteriaceae bacterium]|nr:hypothetical protein [Flavobacteriaceae bacterium]
MKKKKVFIDTFYFQYALSGIGTYINELVLGLEKFGSSNIEYVYSHKLSNKKNYINSKFKFIRLLFHLKYFFWKQVLLPIKLIIIKPDILVCPDYIMPFLNFNSKEICVIHDSFFWDYPQNYNKYWGYYFRFFIKICLKKKTTILTTSETSKKNLTKYFFNEILFLYQSFKPNINNKNFKLSNYNIIKNRYILHVGSFDKRKKIITLVKAFYKLKSSKMDFNFKLVIAGKNKVNGNIEVLTEILEFIKKNKLEEDVVITDYLSDTELMGLYSNALLYVFPSSDEGFGIPVLESFSNNLPVICSDIPIFREIGLDSVSFFSLENIDELTYSIFELMHSKIKRDILINNGKNRLKNFSRKTFVKGFESIIFQKIFN